MKSGLFCRARVCLLAAVSCLLAVAPLSNSFAQIAGFSADQIDSLRERAETGDTDLGPGERPSDLETQKYEGGIVENLPSRLEIFYSNRAGEPLLQFGYETFGSGRDVTLRKAGGVQENYVVGIGDTISIDLRGQENRSFRVKVDNVGRIILPKLDPISVAGRRFGDFRGQLERQIEAAYIATNVFASIEEVRQVSVLMSGEINEPGPLTLSGLSTSIDALLLAGGVKKTGSLRNIKVYRGNEVIQIDLYSILLGSQPSGDFSLMEGDRIHVAPIGRAIVIGGWVKRPGIYELSLDGSTLTVADMIALAGGYEVKGSYGLSLLQVTPTGAVKIVEVETPGLQMREGDLLLVEPNDARAQGAVYLEGHVRQSGTVALSKSGSLKSLLAEGEAIGASAYMTYAVIARMSPASQLKTYIPFSPLDVVYGSSDLDLLEDDIVHIFSLEEVEAISNTLTEDKEEEFNDNHEPEREFPAVNLGARRLIGLVEEQTKDVREGESGRLSRAHSQGMLLEEEVRKLTERNLLNTGLGKMGFGRKIDLEDEALLSLFAESRIALYGALKAPGDYFVMSGISLGQAIEMAGGLAVHADLSSVEITSTKFEPRLGTSQTNRRFVSLDAETLRTIKLGPTDVVRVRRVYSNRLAGSVDVSGEVKFPGRFDLIRGERLSSLVQRAGGLTSTAYPYGAVFTRISAAKAEKDARDQLVDRMESQLATAVASGDLKGEGAIFLADLIKRLKEAPTPGRVSIEADPAVLVANGEKNPLLEPGDHLTIPSRPNSVTVVGEVLSPASYSFDTSLDGTDYVHLAGGYTQFADKKRAFIILPDGRAQRLSKGRWQFRSEILAPGSTVVVPKNLRPFQWAQFLVGLTEVSSQLALTAASISVVGRDGN